MCVGQRRPEDTDERVLLFLKMRAGHAFSDILASDIRAAIRKALSARHVPAYIFSVEDIPVRKAVWVWCGLSLINFYICSIP